MKRSLTRKTYDDMDVAKITEALQTGSKRHVPRRKALTLRGVIEASKDAINELRERGYTIDQICQMITEGGFEASHATLRRHISAVRERQGRPRNRARGRPATGSRVRQPVARTGEQQAKTAPATTEQPPLPRGQLEIAPDRDDL